MNLQTAALIPIQAVPGLFISDRFAARSTSLLIANSISHILSVTRWEDLPISSAPMHCLLKHIDLDDDPTEDLLAHIDEIYEWIEDALRPLDGEDIVKGGVLVHCNRGISRSGAVIVAYLMKSRSLSYKDALALARESRALISPNMGFEYQLRIWEKCGHEVFVSEASSASDVTAKAEYMNWKKEMEDIYARDEPEGIQYAREDWLRSLPGKLDSDGVDG